MGDGAADGATQTIADRLLGAVGGGMIVMAVLVLLFGGPGDGASAPPRANEIPGLSILAPAQGEALAPPHVLHFTAPVAMVPSAGGWGVGSLHLHMAIGDRDIMPRRDDITQLPSGGYRWTLPPLPPGEHEISLFWSGPDHRPIEEGRSGVVRMRVR